MHRSASGGDGGTRFSGVAGLQQDFGPQGRIKFGVSEGLQGILHWGHTLRQAEPGARGQAIPQGVRPHLQEVSTLAVKRGMVGLHSEQLSWLCDEERSAVQLGLVRGESELALEAQRVQAACGRDAVRTPSQRHLPVHTPSPQAS